MPPGGPHCREAPGDLRFRIEDLYAAYDDVLDEGEYERWPEFFLESCIYKVIPRENFERDLPLATILCESRGMLQDRVVALRETALYAPRRLRHYTSGLRIRSRDDGGLRVTANFLLIQTMVDQPSEVFLAGRYHDRVVEDGGSLRFAEKLCVYDSTIVPTSLVFPV